MNKNIGTLDKWLRLVIGAVMLSQVFFGLQTAWGYIGVIIIATALINFCPIYFALGLRTNTK